VCVQAALSVWVQRLTVRPADVTDHQDEIRGGDGSHEQHGSTAKMMCSMMRFPAIARAQAMFYRGTARVSGRG
jgi:hypothetical protein